MLLYRFISHFNSLFGNSNQAWYPPAPKTPDSPFDGETQEQGPVDETQVQEDERPQREKPKMALVLGPGAFKTFAYPSFLKALSQSGVQVDEIIGIEWGALVGSFLCEQWKAP